MGIRLANLQEFTAAHSYLREAVEIDPTYAPGFSNLGRLLLMSRDYDYAISCLQEATRVEPDNDLFLLQLGRAWKDRGFVDKALPWYEKAVELNPLNVETRVGLIDARLALAGRSADLQQGLRQLEELLEIEPDNTDVKDRIRMMQAAIDGVRRGAAKPLPAGHSEDDGHDHGQSATTHAEEEPNPEPSGSPPSAPGNP
jgi:tetratricopeptide (TPR) repeat protein